MQTVQLLGKDTGYFMGKNFMEETGNKKLKEVMADVMRRDPPVHEVGQVIA